ncbi:MAG: hypothetical protein JWP02_779 [Acidimicrobiales bacterium]|nr:hypothetical protein [Acidimicrobiales bacterium]
MRLAVCAAALAATAGWLVVTAPAGTAAGAMETAWWWQAEAAARAVPAPPTVPDGGLWVQSNASGPQAVSGVRVPLDAGDAAPTLVLVVHQAAPPDQLALAAYPTTTSWPAGPGQAWSSKPAYDPGGVAAAGTVSADGKQVTFDLSGLVTGDKLNVVIAPAPVATPPPAPLPAPPPSPPTFDATFEKPDAHAFRVQPAPAPDVGLTQQPAPDAVAPIADLGPAPASLAPALAAGLVAPPPIVAAVPRATAAPRVPFTNVRRRLLPATAKRSVGDSAAIAVMLAVVLLSVARDAGPRSGLRRPRLSLYDAPKPAEAGAVGRSGTPPPLR